MIRNLTDALAIICFGWPAIFVSLALALGGLMFRKPNWLMIAGVVFLPFTFFLSNGLQNPLVVMPLFFFASAWALGRPNLRLAWLLFVPLAVLTLWLALVVLTQ